MDHFVYVLFSSRFKKIYIGYTSDIEKRIASHNYLSKKGWTVRYRPWELLYKEELLEKKDALLREKQLKTAKGREFIWQIVNERTAE
jgi:putative endonuclease